MEKRHFNAIAAALRDTRPPAAAYLRLHTWTNTALELARVLAPFNARFDRNRFLRACGVEGF